MGSYLVPASLGDFCGKECHHAHMRKMSHAQKQAIQEPSKDIIIIGGFTEYGNDAAVGTVPYFCILRFTLKRLASLYCSWRIVLVALIHNNLARYTRSELIQSVSEAPEPSPSTSKAIFHCQIEDTLLIDCRFDALPELQTQFASADGTGIRSSSNCAC